MLFRSLDKTLAEIEKSGAQGLAVQADMSKAADIERFMKAVVERLGSEVLRAAASPTVKEALVRQGLTPAPLAAAEYDALLRSEFSKMQKMFRDAGVKVE